MIHNTRNLIINKMLRNAQIKLDNIYKVVSHIYILHNIYV